MTVEPAVSAVPDRAQALSPGWLSLVLGEDVFDAACERIGHGMMSDTYRVSLQRSGNGAASVVVKVAASDAESRRAARTYRSYELEAGFYRELAPLLTARVPLCHWAGWNPISGDYAVVLEDLGAVHGGDQLRGCSPEQAFAAVAELGRLHGAFWNSPVLKRFGWLQRYGQDERATFAAFARGAAPGLVERFGAELSDDTRDLVLRFAGLAGRYDRKGQDGPQTVVHGDYRADNLIFDGDRAVVLDWQNLFCGNGLVDLAYFLGTSLRSEDRRRHEHNLVRRYHDVLAAQGVPLDWADCWTNYRRHAFAGLCVVLRSFDALRFDAERGGRLVVMAERSARQVLDLSAEDLLR